MLTQSHTTATALLARFRSVRSATMEFCRPAYARRPSWCSPALRLHRSNGIWRTPRGSLRTFVLREFVAAYQPFDPDFLWLFNSYYKSLGEMPGEKLRASFSRPPLDQILAYREAVDTGICRLLEHMPEDEALRRIALGLEHEQQHLELIATDIKHAFFTNPLHPAYTRPAAPIRAEAIAPPLNWINYSPGYRGRPGVVEVGVSPDPRPAVFWVSTPSPSTTKLPATPSTSPPSASRPASSPAPSTSPSSKKTATPAPNFRLSEGWDTMRAEELAKRRSPTGSATLDLETCCRRQLEAFTPPSRLPASWRTLRNPRLPPAASSKPTPSRAAGRLPPPPPNLNGSSPLPTLSPPRIAAGWGKRSPQQICHSRPEAAHICHPAAAVERPASSSVPNMLGVRPPSTPPPASPAPGLAANLRRCVGRWTQSLYTGYPGYHPLPGALGEYNEASSCRRRWSSAALLRNAGNAHPRYLPELLPNPPSAWQFSGLPLGPRRSQPN